MTTTSVGGGTHSKSWGQRVPDFKSCNAEAAGDKWSKAPKHTHNRFTAFFLGPPGCASARRELLDFIMQGKINRGRHTDHSAGRHSIRTNQCPPPPSPHIFYRPDALPAAQPTASKHWRQEAKQWMEHIALMLTSGLTSSFLHPRQDSWLQGHCSHYAGYLTPVPRLTAMDDNN